MADDARSADVVMAGDGQPSAAVQSYGRNFALERHHDPVTGRMRILRELDAEVDRTHDAVAKLLRGPIRVIIEHEAPIALGDKLEIIAHVYPAGSTDKFGPGLVDRTVITLTYANGDEIKAIASIFAL